jgi:hypothetical protein
MTEVVQEIFGVEVVTTYSTFSEAWAAACAVPGDSVTVVRPAR